MKKLFCKDAILAEAAVTAETFSLRLMGMSWRKKWPSRDGFDIDAYIFPECSAVHTFFMFICVDVIFLDSSDKIVKVIHSMPPWRIAAGGKDAVCTVELPAGTLKMKNVNVGDILTAQDQHAVILPPIA